MFDDRYRIIKSQIRHSFDKAAPRYDEVAILQREVASRLLERLDLIKLAPQQILDLGCGTGHNSQHLDKRYKRAQVISLDLAPNMIKQARKHKSWFNKQCFICGDAEALPLMDNSVDLIFSSLTIQWCHDLDSVFKECFRILRPGGLLMFSTLGPDTLHELRSSWQKVDSNNHVNAFIDMHDIGDAMIRSRLSDPVMDVENITMTYNQVMTLMRDLKILGAHNMTHGRPRNLTSKTKMVAMCDAYERYRTEGVLPATYEVVYGHAWAPTNKQEAQNGADGVFRFPLDQLRKR
ncbi:MAG: malonyl-ACP O-methyltransferase BioC [Gammaproteobacteria bacterium]|nr:malonyl-ACP O-methyltransferase BioC [Gammaproteobacteria bacterium]